MVTHTNWCAVEKAKERSVPDSNGNFKGISVPELPWLKRDQEKPADKQGSDHKGDPQNGPQTRS